MGRAVLLVFTWLLCAATSVQADDPVDADSQYRQQHTRQVKHSGSFNAQSASDSAREAHRLYLSSLKILATLKAKSDAARKASDGASSASKAGSILSPKRARTQPVLTIFESAHVGSTLLEPASATPLLDFLEDAVNSRTQSLVRAMRLMRRLLSRPRSPDARFHSSETSRASTTPVAVPSASHAEPDTNNLAYGRLRRLLSNRHVSLPATRSVKEIQKKQQVRAAMALAVERLENAFSLGKTQAGLLLADLHLWGRFSLQANVTQAFAYYHQIATETGDPTAQYMMGFLLSSNYGHAAAALTDTKSSREGEGNQGSAVLHYTFSALGGQTEAEQTMGYRHWVGIGVKQSCQDALPWYKTAADKAMLHFKSGPPGGRHLPPAKARLADIQGGVYGPGASAMLGVHGHHGQHHSHHHPTTEREWEDVLEYYHFHADRGDATFMFRIGRIYYQGFNAVGVAGGGMQEHGGRDFARAIRWFMRIARTVWPRDPIDAYVNPSIGHHGIERTDTGKPGGPARQYTQQALAYYDETQDVKLKVDDHLLMAAGLASGYLGRMYLRGEGFPEQDLQKAYLWFQRGISQGDRESHNGLGVMYRDGLGVTKDMQKAITHFQTAAAADHAEAQVNYGKILFYRSDYTQAAQHFELALRHGDALQSYYFLAEINAHSPDRPDLCPVATAFYKLVAERGDWLTSQPWWDAEKAWAAGDKYRALLGYWIMAERGYEAAQNNVAWMLDQDKTLLNLPFYDYRLQNITERLALMFWTRSAAQDNFDSLVKMGDYYLKGLGIPSGIPQPEKAAACYASAASSHVSSLAMHNLGWMHENGIGVTQDFHLAKRYYDLSLETNAEAYLPVTMSLIKLHMRSLYSAIITGDVKSISLFVSSDADLDENAGGKSAKAKTPWLWSWRRLRDEFFRRWAGEEMAKQLAQRQIDEREAAAGVTPPLTDPVAATPDVAAAASSVAQRARADMEGNEDPVLWARRKRDEMILQGQQQEEFVDDLEIPDFFGDTTGGRGAAGGDDLLETLAIVGLCLFLGWLVYIRQARYDGARARRNAAHLEIANVRGHDVPAAQVLAPVAAANTAPQEASPLAEPGPLEDER